MQAIAATAPIARITVTRVGNRRQISSSTPGKAIKGCTSRPGARNRKPEPPVAAEMTGERADHQGFGE